MKIAQKLTLALLSCVVVALTINAAVQVRKELARFEDSVREHQNITGSALRPAIAQAWKTDGRDRALSLVEDANGGIKTVDIRWVWLDGRNDARFAPWVPGLTRARIDAEPNAAFRAMHEGEERLCSYFPLTLPGEASGALEVSESLAPEQEVRAAALRQGIGVGLGIVLVSAAASSVFGVLFVGRPIRAIVVLAERIGAGDLSYRLPLRSKDEMSMLATAMNAMCDRLVAAHARETEAVTQRLRALEQVRHADRLATVGRLAAGLAHEIGTPLNVASARAKTIATGRAEGDAARDSARIIHEQVDRIARLMRQLLDFARTGELRKARVDLRTIVRRTVAFLTPLASKRHVGIEIAGDDAALEADVDPSQLEQVLTNLLVNALDASTSGKRIAVTLSRAAATPPADDGRGALECARIEVRDEGAGIPAEIVPRIFEPFFTTKGVGEGTGLGLSVSYGIVKDHGGWIAVESEPGRGSAFTTYLPKEMA